MELTGIGDRADHVTVCEVSLLSVWTTASVVTTGSTMGWYCGSLVVTEAVGSCLSRKPLIWEMFSEIDA